ncbi:hypothetical protein FOMA001_g14774 [Fusarium oxysporum f. sp. matthiolae]|nr:hypothetical protein FOMA001_g14774 [Fusarium oxysporum f. sp. matthiolae]
MDFNIFTGNTEFVGGSENYVGLTEVTIGEQQ